MTRILILGASGNLGKLTSARLASDYPDAALRLASSRDEGISALKEANPGAEVMSADWYDKASLAQAMTGVDRVFVVVPDFFTDENLVTPNIIAAAKEVGGIKQILRLIALPPGLTIDQLSADVAATRCGAAIHSVAKAKLDASGLPVTYLNVACWIMFNLPWFMAEEVKTKRRLAMPAAADAPRRWVSENDIAEVAAKLLTDDPERHVGREYLMTGKEQYTFRDVAELLTEILHQKIPYIDDDQSLRAAMGDMYDKTMTYFSHETRDYVDVPASDTLEALTGKKQTTLPAYLEANKALFT